MQELRRSGHTMLDPRPRDLDYDCRNSEERECQRNSCEPLNEPSCREQLDGRWTFCDVFQLRRQGGRWILRKRFLRCFARGLRKAFLCQADRDRKWVSACAWLWPGCSKANQRLLGVLRPRSNSSACA